MSTPAQKTPEFSFCVSEAAVLCERYFECFTPSMLEDRASSIGKTEAECEGLLSADCGRFSCGPDLQLDVETGDQCVQAYRSIACAALSPSVEPTPCLTMCQSTAS